MKRILNERRTDVKRQNHLDELSDVVKRLERMEPWGGVQTSSSRPLFSITYNQFLVGALSDVVDFEAAKINKRLSLKQFSRKIIGGVFTMDDAEKPPSIRIEFPKGQMVWIETATGRLLKRGDTAICATALYFDDEDITVDWNEHKKEFQVRLVSKDRSRHSRLITSLTLDVAPSSSCSCGSELLLTDYSVRRVDNELIFEGTYICKQCSKAKRPWFGELTKVIKGIWQHTTRIEVGPTGVKYEKDTKRHSPSAEE